MNLIESGQQLSSVDVAGIAGFVSGYLAFHLAVGEAARWVTEKTLGIEIDEEGFEQQMERAPSVLVYPNHASFHCINFLKAGCSWAYFFISPRM